MSVQSEINRIFGNVTAALSAIAEKGVTVPSGSKSDALASLIAAIEAGGGDSHENCIPYEEKIVLSYTVDTVDGAQYGFALNGAGYYESQNKGKSSSYALCRVNLTVNVACDVEFSVINYAENNYDYGLFGVLDTALNKNASADSVVKKSFKSEHSANEVSLVYENVPAGNHFIDVKFIKDSSENKNNDSLKFKIVAGDTITTISPEYYPIISRTTPVIDTLAAISNKGIDTTDAGFADIAALVDRIETAGSVKTITGTYTLAEANQPVYISYDWLSAQGEFLPEIAIMLPVADTSRRAGSGNILAGGVMILFDKNTKLPTKFSAQFSGIEVYSYEALGGYISLPFVNTYVNISPDGINIDIGGWGNQWAAGTTFRWICAWGATE